MKKIVCLFIVFALCFACSGCLHVGFPGSGVDEEGLYAEQVDVLITAVNEKDASGIVDMFAPDVKRAIPGLADEAEKLIEILYAPIERNGNDGILQGNYEKHYGEKKCTLSNRFPVIAGEKYYWIYFEYTYRDDASPESMGARKIALYTADEFYLLGIEGKKMPDGDGIFSFGERDAGVTLRSVCGTVCEYENVRECASAAEIKEFFVESDSLVKFKERFGEPDADGLYDIYALSAENGEPRYLEIRAVNDRITYAQIVSDFFYIETVCGG